MTGGMGSVGGVATTGSVVEVVGWLCSKVSGWLGAGAHASIEAVRSMTPIKPRFFCIGIPFVWNTFALYSLYSQTHFEVVLKC
jgi:hypothetical protein